MSSAWGNQCRLETLRIQIDTNGDRWDLRDR
jgi:hypothetical protein